MTVCIAVQAFSGEIVTVTDQMLTIGAGEFTSEGAAQKEISLTRGWLALVAGADVSAAPSLLRRIQADLEEHDEPSIQTVQLIVRTAYQDERRRAAVDEVLSPWSRYERFLG